MISKFIEAYKQYRARKQRRRDELTTFSVLRSFVRNNNPHEVYKIPGLTTHTWTFVLGTETFKVCYDQMVRGDLIDVYKVSEDGRRTRLVGFGDQSRAYSGWVGRCNDYVYDASFSLQLMKQILAVESSSKEEMHS